VPSSCGKIPIGRRSVGDKHRDAAGGRISLLWARVRRRWRISEDPAVECWSTNQPMKTYGQHRMRNVSA